MRNIKLILNCLIYRCLASTERYQNMQINNQEIKFVLKNGEIISTDFFNATEFQLLDKNSDLVIKLDMIENAKQFEILKKFCISDSKVYKLHHTFNGIKSVLDALNFLKIKGEPLKNLSKNLVGIRSLKSYSVRIKDQFTHKNIILALLLAICQQNMCKIEFIKDKIKITSHPNFREHNLKFLSDMIREDIVVKSLEIDCKEFCCPNRATYENVTNYMEIVAWAIFQLSIPKLILGPIVYPLTKDILYLKKAILRLNIDKLEELELIRNETSQQFFNSLKDCLIDLKTIKKIRFYRNNGIQHAITSIDEIKSFITDRKIQESNFSRE